MHSGAEVTPRAAFRAGTRPPPNAAVLEDAAAHRGPGGVPWVAIVHDADLLERRGHDSAHRQTADHEDACHAEISQVSHTHLYRQNRDRRSSIELMRGGA